VGLRRKGEFDWYGKMNNHFEQYFRSAPCFLTVQDKDFRIIDANDWFKKEFGDFEGRHCYQVYKHRPDKCEQCPVERTFRDGQSHKSEELVRTIGGREISVIVYTTPITNGNGEVTAVMEMSTDITEIDSLRRQLRESQQRYLQLFEEVPCYISIQDKELRIVDANRLHRETFGEGYGEKCYKIYKHRIKECFPCTVRQTFKDGIAHIHEEVVTSQKGEPLNVLVCTAPIVDAKGDIKYVIEMSANITQIRLLQDKLSSIGLLISSISHGVRGLLNGIDGGAYLLNSGMERNDNARIRQGWEMAQRNIEQIRRMMLDILYYAKSRQPVWENISGKELMEDISKIIAPKAAKLNIDLRGEFPSDGVPMVADYKALQTLLINLIENSIDACRVDKKKDHHFIKLCLNLTTDMIEFEIEDNGIGMDRETREKAFTLFFSSKGTEGTGLGLFISHNIAKDHGGSISVESEEDKGTRFLVRLPRKNPIMPEDSTEPRSS
jgi:PAS domain S-box-containing protein